MSLVVRPASDADLPAYVGLQNSITPDWPTDVEQILWARRTYPGGGRFLAERDGRIVGAANTGRIYMHPPDYPDWWAELVVAPDARRGGIGTELLRTMSALARDAGKTGFQVPGSDARPEGSAFLRRHGFVEFERSKAVRLDIDRVEPAMVDLPVPDGIRIVSLADRPDLVPGIHAVALATFDDVPGGDPMSVGELDEFRARDIDRPGIRPDGLMVALAGEDVVGYASLMVEAARPRIGVHDMTAVLPAFRGKGLAKALKTATIRWARKAGLEALETANDEANAPMRAVNAALGYRPMPDLVFFRGPLVDPVAAGS